MPAWEFKVEGGPVLVRNSGIMRKEIPVFQYSNTPLLHTLVKRGVFE
jgi:hypothetical protein